MAVSDGDLDALVGDIFPADIVQALTIASYTTTTTSPAIVATLDAVSTGAQFSLAIGDTGTVTAVNDSANTVSITFSIDGSPIPSETFYVIGFSADSILLSSGFTSEQVAQTGTFANSALASLSTTVLSNGAAVDYDVTASFTGTLPCFVAGTRIGNVPIETLQVGDEVEAVLGGRARIQWIGRRHIDCTQHPDPAKVWPVRIAAGAFGPGLPQRDLWLSPDHAVYFMDVLIPVKHLVTGGAVEQVPVDTVDYYHLELPRHDLLLAEGLPAESYLDTGTRADFVNGGVVCLQPAAAAASPPADPVMQWESRGCAPLVVCGPQVDAARRLLSAAVSTYAAAA